MNEFELSGNGISITKNETQFCELPVYLPSSDTQFRKQFFGAHCKISISLEATFNPAQLTVHWQSIFQQSHITNYSYNFGQQLIISARAACTVIYNP